MTLNELRDEVLAYAEKQGFHEVPFNFGESLMLIVSELSEALESDRKGAMYDPQRVGTPYSDPENVPKSEYEAVIRGTVAEELADATIRLCHLAGRMEIDLDWHVRAKMAYNKTRPYRHGKKY
jgi:NTP pyrophosphatase (non-canonical NTP hydrolase)